MFSMCINLLFGTDDTPQTGHHRLAVTSRSGRGQHSCRCLLLSLRGGEAGLDAVWSFRRIDLPPFFD
ncbi:hypothetical protein OYC64_020428 [Pagothenia borchgrevinki]|uniref:Uncharacterized protein n=1 Tax=Pagothenia borchgrevinki TaxID=8213 RepID=A0ABD2FL75_PAGBO